MYWTNASIISFSFTSFDEDQPDALRYSWALGTTAGSDDAVHWQPFTGTASPAATVQLPSGEIVENATLYQETYQLIGQALQQGQAYYVTVQAQNRGGSQLSFNQTSSAVKVSGYRAVIGWAPVTAHSGALATQTRTLPADACPVALHVRFVSQWVPVLLDCACHTMQHSK